MVEINYEIKNPLFPFDFALQHFKATLEETTWEGRIVHLIVGFLEFLFPINYIIAVFDRIIVTEQQRLRALPPMHPISAPKTPSIYANPQPNPNLLAGDPNENSPPLDPNRNGQGKLQSYLMQLTERVSLGLTGARRPMSEHLKMLAERGIQSTEDLHALGLFKWDEMGSRIKAFLEEIFYSIGDWNEPVEAPFTDILIMLSPLKERACPDRQAPDYDPKIIQGVHIALVDVKERLEAHIEEVLNDSTFPLSVKDRQHWEKSRDDLKLIEQGMSKFKHDLRGECDAFEALTQAIQSEEFKRLERRKLDERLRPQWELLKEDVAIVSQYVETLQTIEERFVSGQYLPEEVAMFEEMIAVHKNMTTTLEAISQALASYNAENLMQQAEAFQKILKQLEEYDSLSQVAQLRLYVNQVIVTVAWKVLNKQGITNLQTLRHTYPDFEQFDLYQLGQTWS